ncbi:hypothetical protein ACFWDI_28240 [Streptomyces sp. NPDC060064]|uniref:hypothetical protein n=1 Tax=Streptomyces sp. NPDC060064 TaxID=3347049 RepID=UPI0036987F3A
MGKQKARAAMAQIVATVAANKRSADKQGGSPQINADLAGVKKLSRLLDRLPDNG